jgi:putative Holliday junction resolvase
MSVTTALAFDFGCRKIGIAVGQDLSRSAQGIVTLRHANNPAFWQQIQDLISEWQPRLLVVGLPLHMDGSESEMSRSASKFARRLHERYRLPVYLVDERLSSDAASATLQSIREQGKSARRSLRARDELAAELILNSFYGTKHPESLKKIP